MAFIFRKLDRKAAFYRVNWIRDGDVQGDALYDLRTSSNTLSVWMVDEDQANLNRIIAALAAGRQTLDKLDYALIERQRLDRLGIDIAKVNGVSGDEKANTLWHQDLRGLSGARLVDLAYLMQEHAKFGRVQKKRVAALIIDSLKKGFIRPDQVGERLRAKLQLFGHTPA